MHSNFDGLGRFAEPWLLVLTSLSDGPKHGYAIMTDVAAFSGVRMEPGTFTGHCPGWSAAAGSGRWPPGSAAGTRSLPPGRAGQARAPRPIVRATWGRPRAATVVDRPHHI